MNPRKPCSVLLLLCTLLLSANTFGEGQKKTSENLLRQELLLNQLITSLCLLQIDALDRATREEVIELSIQMDNHFSSWPKQDEPNKAHKLSHSVSALWPVIMKNIQSVAAQPEHKETNIRPLIHSLNKLSVQFTAYRNRFLEKHLQEHEQLPYLQQAVLMQQMASEYLSSTLNMSKKAEDNEATQPLKTMAQTFKQNITQMHEQLLGHPHAGQPIKQSFLAWQFIEPSIQRFPQQPIPNTIVRFSNQIVKKLASVQRML